MSVTKNLRINPRSIINLPFWIITLGDHVLILLNFKRNLQQAIIRFVVESTPFLLFLKSFLLNWIPQKLSYNTVPLRIAPKLDKFAESAWVFAEFFWNNLRNTQTNNKISYKKRAVAESATVKGISKLSTKSAKWKWNSHFLRIPVLYI